MNISIRKLTAAALLAFLSGCSGNDKAVEKPVSGDPETRIVEHLREIAKPGQPVIVGDLQRVFNTPEEQQALNRLFNTFFKVPMFVMQFQSSMNRMPTLQEIAEQFDLKDAGEADVLLRVMDYDPRIPKFLKRDPATGEVLSVDQVLVMEDPRFGRTAERALAAWEGKPAPAFSIVDFGGQPVESSKLVGTPHLIYFWFTNCPPCTRTSPWLAELDAQYGPKGFKILGVNADQVLDLPYTDPQRAEYLRNAGVQFTNAHLTPAMQEDFGSVGVFPTMFFIDRKGTIVEHFVGFQERAVLDAALESTMK